MGVGTTRGAGVTVPGVWALERASALGGAARGMEEGRAAAADCAARASATGSTVSPSKNLAIAIWRGGFSGLHIDCGGYGARRQTWTFHWERRSRGIASMGDWAVTAVNCSRTARCESDSCVISAELGEADMAADRWWGGGVVFRL